MLSCLARTPFKPVNNDSDDDSDCNSDATPSRYAKLVFSSTDRATDEFIVKLRATLPTTLQPRVISLRAEGVPTHELAQMGFRQNALPAYVRADYGRLLESEDSL